ncbi:MAG: acetyl-CoA C-acyltransferase [Phycisphaerales bacterium]|nr:acetyl-CoA C-acyltransferase [Phycisphaerales bacterium]
MRRVAIIDAVRTPIGRYGGALASIRPDDLAALVIGEVVKRTGVDPALVEEVYFGAANQAGEDNRNVARMAALLAGLPDTVAGCTINRLCSSGLDAINIAARMIESGAGDVMIAGGVESMSRAPFVFGKHEHAWDRTAPEVFDTTIGWRFTNPRLAKAYYPFSMGETAENVARKYEISRADQDRFALASQQKWAAANAAGKFSDEIVPVEIAQRKGPAVVVDTDEHPRPETTLEALIKLRPAFAKDDQGTVTAGNSSGINDGAAALLLVEAGRATELGLRPLAFVGPNAAAGVDPACMGIGPVSATKKVMQRYNKGLGCLDIIELNEAFAAQSLAVLRQLGLERANVNPNGGAIAMGHPLGCSGARLVTTLVHEMRRTKARVGLATLCVGVGQGVATIFEGA